MPPSQRGGPQCFSFWDFLYLCLHSLTQNCQFRGSNHMGRDVFTRSAVPLPVAQMRRLVCQR